MIVDKDGLNMRSRSVSINVFGPANPRKQHDVTTQVNTIKK